MAWKLDDKVKTKLHHVRLLILDVDGVMTDGRIIMDDEGREIKHFNVRDGHGLKILMHSGIDVVLLTGRRSRVVEHRAKDLGIREVHQAIWNKAEAFEQIRSAHGLEAHNAAFMGDDIVDIPLLRKVGFSACPADACLEVRNIVDYIAEYDGGHGAVREICEIILQAQGKWADVAAKYGFA
jgi:3-deoxy-D-manno-octulosonate 8-phosphate phosphatase (KDO 8-P phosphatase)